MGKPIFCQYLQELLDDLMNEKAIGK